MEAIIKRFIRYVMIDTTADADSLTVPSTVGQLHLANLLVSELIEIGLEEVSLDKNGYIMATLPSNTDRVVPTIGFIAHMDTAPDITGKDANPQVIYNYDGKDILLNEEKQILLSPKDFPELKAYKGKTLITTDGTTLLGADDKAGIVEIITAMEYLSCHPEIPHGRIQIGFTPDEEISKGADYFDVSKFNADFAYTIDGGPIGELEYENFNAAFVKIIIQGRNVHPGTAKNKMINSMEIAMELGVMLPENQKPQFTEGYEGFFHLLNFNGTVEQTTLQYLIRDHDSCKFESKKDLMTKIVEFLNHKYGEFTVTIDMIDQYYNMKEKIEPVIHIIKLAKEAMEAVGVIPDIKPIRGGTDGARLSYMGLPCPNIFTGGHNFHGKYEYIPVESMMKAVEVIVKIAQINLVGK